MNLQNSTESHEATLLAAISADKSVHFRFLNTLSLLEHIGSRKVISSHSIGSDVSSDVIQHLAEEARHAWFFKKAAQRMAERALSYDATDLLAGSSARSYMNRVDAFAAQAFSGEMRYVGTSLVIELRALSFYRRYAAANIQGSPSLSALLAEEQRHAAEFQKAMHDQGCYDTFRSLVESEARAYLRLVLAFIADVRGSKEIMRA